MSGENLHDQPIEKLKFDINVYNVIYDKIIYSLEKTFDIHRKLYENKSYLHLQYFINTNLLNIAFEFLRKNNSQIQTRNNSW